MLAHRLRRQATPNPAPAPRSVLAGLVVTLLTPADTIRRTNVGLTLVQSTTLDQRQTNIAQHTMSAGTRV